MGASFPDSCAAKFRPVRQLASGGFGAVWEAVQLELDRNVAVKLPAAEAFASEEERRHFEREARLTARLEHRNIVRVLDWGLGADGAWIAYELLPGPTLRAHLDRARPPLDETLRIVRQVALALEPAHRAGIIHRDIKPENVMAAGPDWWKVMDFGVARWVASPVQTKTGVILGTPLYIAPEQVKGERATAASDLYAAGVLLFEMITGALPHDAERAIDILLRRASEPPPRLADVAPHAPSAVDALVARLLEPDPRTRLVSAADLARQLDEILSGALVVAAPAPSSAPPAPARATRTGRERTRVSSRPDRTAGPAPVRRGTTGSSRALGAGAAQSQVSPLAVRALLATAAIGLLLAGAWNVMLRLHPPATVAAERRDGTSNRGGVASVASAPSPTPSPAARDGARVPAGVAAVLARAPVRLRRWPEDPVRCALLVPHDAADVALELAGGWRLASIDVRPLGGEGVVPLGPLTAGLHWIGVAGSGVPPVATVRGLAASGPAPRAHPEQRRIQTLYREVIRIHGSRHIWDPEETLPGPAGAPGSPTALAAAALALRYAGEIPDAFNLTLDASGKTRMVWDFKAVEVRQRALAAVEEATRALAVSRDRWDAWHLLGWVLANADQRDVARLALARALEIWPESPWSWGELARLERRELRAAEDAGMPRALVAEVLERARFAAQRANAFSREIVTDKRLEQYRLELDAMGRNIDKDTARFR